MTSVTVPVCGQSMYALGELAVPALSLLLGCSSCHLLVLTADILDVNFRETRGKKIYVLS